MGCGFETWRETWLANTCQPSEACRLGGLPSWISWRPGPAQDLSSLTSQRPEPACLGMSRTLATPFPWCSTPSLRFCSSTKTSLKSNLFWGVIFLNVMYYFGMCYFGCAISECFILGCDISDVAREFDKTHKIQTRVEDSDRILAFIF